MQCTAKSKQSGQQCKRHAVPGMSVCAIHGGKSPKGIASPNLKHARHSKYLPGVLLERYEQFADDDEILNLRGDIALIDTRVATLLEALPGKDLGARWIELQQTYELMAKSATAKDLGAGKAAFESLGLLIGGGANEFRTWSHISDLLEQRRKLVETERKRLVDMQQMITAEQAMLMVTALVDIVKKRVSDVRVLAAISSDIAILLSQPVIPGVEADE